MTGKIFNISNDFLKNLAQFVLENHSHQLFELTILLPSRRASRQLKEIFLESSENKAVILPKIIAIGDVDYDAALSEMKSLQNIPAQNKITEIEYQFELLQAIKEWNLQSNLFGKNISAGALFNIAENLEQFLGEVEKEGIDLNLLGEIDDAEMSSHRQKILQFLNYFSSIWQNNLLKKGLISTAKRQNLMIQSFNNHLKGSLKPIIAAGTTGSVKETLNLLATISKLENGSIILFGLDQNLDEEIWQEISDFHPQFMLKKLLGELGYKRNEVFNIGVADRFIADLTSKIMLPAEFSNRWNELQNSCNNHSLTKIEAENEFEEARSIALIMREALEIKGKEAALISNNKNLIQLVKSNLTHWNIEIDDSAFSNLAESKLAHFLFEISNFSSQDFSAVNLLCVLKNPFCNIAKDNLIKLELETLRRVSKFFSFDDVLLKIKDDEQKIWLKEIADILQPLISEFQKEEISFSKIVNLHLNCFEKLGGNCGDFEDLKDIKSNLKIDSISYNQLLFGLLKNIKYKKSGAFHPRLHILSTIEARLINFDLTIISGLSEGEFPSKSSDDWLGNKIRKDLGLSSVGRKIGVAAYDFCNYLGSKEIFLTYSKSQNNSPTIKSRFLLKLETFLKASEKGNFLKDGSRYLHYFNSNSAQEITQKTAIKTSQKLTKISATDISKWLRNPYSIYAKRILNLKPLKIIEQQSSFAEFGNFVHKALEKFVQNDGKQDLIKIGVEIFAKYFPDPSSRLLWWPKFENIAAWFLAQESDAIKSYAEVEAQSVINGVLLTTKIDRINLFEDGSFEIIDYKTGMLPAPKDVKSGLEPQLAVEALILRKGTITNFNDLNLGQVKDLQYQNLKGRDQNEIKNLGNIDQLLTAAEDGISRLLESYPEIGFICAPNLDIYKKDDYWHLARIGEEEIF
ncbi:MAG: ATP-dependent helicase/nuclease subunit B [Lentimonas sp.]|jgi:ATP-dependent helicase/nuclease subunit B